MSTVQFWTRSICLLAVVAALSFGVRMWNERRGPEVTLSSSPAADASVPTLYRETDAIATGLQKARAMAIDPQGRVWVAGDREIRRLPGSPSEAPERISIQADPTALAIGSDGVIYAALGDHIEVFGPDGQRQAVWPSPGPRTLIVSLAAPTPTRLRAGTRPAPTPLQPSAFSLHPSPTLPHSHTPTPQPTGGGSAADTILAGDAGNRVVLKYNRQGALLGRLGQKDASRGVPGIVVPSPHLAVAIGPDGTPWVANPGRHSVEAFSTDGKLKQSWGKATAAPDGFSGCCNPTDLLCLPDGRFITAEKGIVRVKLSSADGRLEGWVAGPGQFSPADAGLPLAVDLKGRVLILDPANRTVRVFVPLKADERTAS